MSKVIWNVHLETFAHPPFVCAKDTKTVVLFSLDALFSLDVLFIDNREINKTLHFYVAHYWTKLLAILPIPLGGYR